MGGSSSQVVGYRYYAKFAAFIGNRIEKLIAINFDNRGWIVKDQDDASSILNIDKPYLYGENEGGVYGDIEIYNGTPDQQPSATYQEYFPLVSGYPYQSYLIFRGSPLAARWSPAYGVGGFYLGNSGYMKEMLLWVKRIHVKNNGDVQWYDIKSEIPDYKNNSGSGGDVIERPLYDHASTIYGSSTAFYSEDAKLEISVADQERTGLPMFYSKNGIYNYENAENYSVAGAHGGDFDFVKAGYRLDFGEITGLVRLIVISQNTSKTYFEDELTNANILSKQVLSTLISENRGVEVKRKTLEYILLIEEPGKFFKFELQANGSVFGDGTSFLESWIYFEPQGIDSFSGASDEILSGDLNPIHKIREILTDDTAMGKPESDVNDANFIKAADRIWDEGLGISWAIDEKSCIEAIEELCYHIEAGIRVNRQTGLYEMVLFRDDWFAEEEIHDITENKIKDLSLEVMNSDDIVNQLNVTYYDRQRIKNSTFSIYENGSILTMGHANAESIDFPYFMKMRNAEIVANWKLKQFSTPAWSGSFTTGWREARKWNRYDLIRLPWSKKWNGTILVRIMKINLGNGADNTVTIDFEEVIPYSSEMNTSIVVDAPVESAPQPPQPSMNAVFEAPYYLTVLRAGQTNADLELSNNPDIGYVVAIAAKPQSNSLNALLYTDGGVGEFEQVSRLEYCDVLQLDQPIVETTSSFTVTGSLTQTANSNNLILLNDEWMGFVSFDVETKVLTVKRGVLDTTPKKHNSGNLFVFDLPDVAFDSTQYAQSEIVEAQVLTTTPSGIQELSIIGTAVEIQSRAIRPYLPSNVKINGVYYPESHIIANDIVLTWVDRNRLQQTGGEILGFFDTGVAVESGVTYSYELISENVILDSASGISANTATILASTLMPNMPHTLKLWSVRDGYASYQKFEHSFFVEAASLILTATSTQSQVSGNTVPVANISVNVDTTIKANLEFDGSSISGKAVAGSIITIEVEE